MKSNPFDQQRANLVDAMKSERERLRSMSRDVEPYNSVKLSDEEEARLFAEPWRMFPGEPSVVDPASPHLTAAEAYQRTLDAMGPVKYVEWWDKHNVA